MGKHFPHACAIHDFAARHRLRPKLATCADILTQAPTLAREIVLAGKAGAEGVSCALNATSGVLEMVEIPSTTLDRADVDWLSEQLDVRMFTYTSGNISVCEVMRLDTREVVRVESNEATPVNSVRLEMFIFGDGEPAQALVRNVSTGVLQPRFRELGSP